MQLELPAKALRFPIKLEMTLRYSTKVFAHRNRPPFNKPDSSGHRTQRGKADGRTVGSDKHRTPVFQKNDSNRTKCRHYKAGIERAEQSYVSIDD